MKRLIASSAVLLMALGGCATVGTTQAVATPWAAGGFHSFKPQKVAEPSQKKANARVAQVLDDAESGEPVQVAAR